MGKRGFKLLLGLVCTLVLTIVGISTIRAENVSADEEFAWSSESGYAVVVKYNGSSSSVTIPSEHDGKPVRMIKQNAFYQNTSVKSVTIPDSVTSLGTAFVQSSVENVYIGSNVQRIQSDTFLACKSLKKVTVANPDIIWGNSTTEKVSALNLGKTPKFTICAPSGSTSEEFAKKYGHSFETYSGGGSGGSSGGGSSSECSHDWTRDDSDSRNSESTCTTYGNIVQKCTKCGTTRVVKRTALGGCGSRDESKMNLSGWIDYTLATPTSEGVQIKKCLDCGSIYEKRAISYNGDIGEVVTVAQPDNTGSGSGNEGNSGSSGSSGNSGNSGNEGGSSGGNSGSGNSGSGGSSGSGSSGGSGNSGGSGSSSGSGNSNGGSGNGSGNNSGSGNSGLDDIENNDRSSAADVNNDLSALDPDKVLKPNRTVKSIPIFAVVGAVGVIIAVGLFIIKKR